MSTPDTTPAAPAASPTPAPSATGKATKDELNAAIAEADTIVASIAKLQATLNVNDTKFIALTVGVAAERLQEAQRYLRNKLPKAV
jgi:hypothetical protein